MTQNKKYFYLKLKENFFDSEEMKLLESQKNGVEYQCLYLKMCLLSLKNEGQLSFKGAIPYDIQMISTILRVNIDTVRTGIDLFSKLKLIDICDNGAMFMSDIQTLIGHGSTEAERKKIYREKINNARGTLSQDCPKICPPELELELELELKKNNILSGKPDLITPINYLNEKVGTSFNPKSKCNTNLIKARYNEGRTLEDFKTVIDRKVFEWKTDDKMVQYLRPSTLFRATNFENYLNQPTVKPKVTTENAKDYADINCQFCFGEGIQKPQGGAIVLCHCTNKKS